MCEGSKKKSHHKHAVAIRSHQALRVIFRDPSPKDSSNMQLKQLLDIILCEEFEFTSEKNLAYVTIWQGKGRERRKGECRSMHLVQKKMTLKEDVLYSNVKQKWKGAGEI